MTWCREKNSFFLKMKKKYFDFIFQLAGYDVRDVKGDGGCYYRCLSAYFTGAEESYNKYRREVVAYIRDHLGKYIYLYN